MIKDKLYWFSYVGNKNCKSAEDIDSYCENCKKALWSEITKYKHIQEFLNNYSISNNNEIELLFGKDSNLDDVDTVLAKRNLLLTPKIDRRDQDEIDKEAKCFIF